MVEARLANHLDGRYAETESGYGHDFLLVEHENLPSLFRAVLRE